MPNHISKNTWIKLVATGDKASPTSRAGLYCLNVEAAKSVFVKLCNCLSQSFDFCMLPLKLLPLSSDKHIYPFNPIKFLNCVITVK